LRLTFIRTAAIRRLATVVAGGLLLLSAAQSDAQIIFHKRKKVNKATSADNNAEPDKILYDKAMDDIKHGRHEIGRLNLQTLINTYPDSEYLAKAKLAIADSYYREGGTANTTQAIQAYEDFYVFFPMMPEAAYAKLQVAMAHFRQMEKPDRDRTEARSAEDAFQTFLQKYPNDPLASKAEQHLREVQEVLAEGDYRIGYFYYTTKGDKRAAASRLIAVVNRYPLYSKADHALWMLGNIWEGSEKKEFAVPYYARIVKDYPLSPLAPQAKDRLRGLKAPVPQADPKAVAWMTAEMNAPRQHDSLVMKPMALFHSGPKQELYAAAKTGAPTMTPESETEAGLDILAGGARPTSGSSNAIVATVKPGESAPTGAGESVTPAGAPTSGTEQKADGQAEANPPASAGDPNATPASAAGSGDAAGKTDAAKTASATVTAGTTDGAATTDATKTDGTQTENQDKKTKESSSKKKKGLKKLIPW
jgi:outer membrane protein assembly factor BamD